MDLSSPLLDGYEMNLNNLQDLGMLGGVTADLAELEDITGRPWTQEMLVALGASWCNDWPRSATGEDPDQVSPEGEVVWAEAIAPVLGVSVGVAGQAIDSGIWRRYQAVCD